MDTGTRGRDQAERAPTNRITEGGPSAPGAASSLVAAPSLSLPKAGGAIRGIGEKFAANPVTGTGSMLVPIAVSPGRSGFGPQLSLSYDSGRGNGIFGFGWSLSLPAISRKTDKGLPRYADATESDVFLLSDAEDLVPVLDPDQGWARNPLIDPPHAPGYRIDGYRPRTEGLFARIERWTRIGDGDTHWRSVTRDNVTTWYGADANSRVGDPHDPSKVFSWLICRSYDDKGNALTYEYAAEDSAGVDTEAAHERHRTDLDRSAGRHIKRIRYGNRVSRLVDPDLLAPDCMFEAVFDYGEHDADAPTPLDLGLWDCRDDPFSSYRAGFEVRTYRLCRRVLMFHHFPGEAGVGADCLVRSTDFAYQPADAAGVFLAAVTQRGYRRTTSGYVTRSMPPVEFTYSPAELHDEVTDVDPESLANLPAGLAGDGHQWIDLDGEGISGILIEQAGAWYYKHNLGSGRFGPLDQVPTLPSMAGAPGARPQLLDLAGNGQLDVVAFTGPTPGFYERTTDGNWATLRTFPSLPALDWADPNLRFVDLDGDGHADVLITEHEALTWYPSQAEDGFGPAQRATTSHDEDHGPRLVFADGTESVHLADLSGDGLTDLVRIRNGEVCYWPNLGYGRFGRKVTMDDAPWFDRTETFDQRYLLLADVDGSGVTDMIYLAADEVRIYLNRSGNAWSPPHRMPALPGVDNRTTVNTVDLLGTGTTCLVWSSDRPGNERRSIRYVDLLGGVHPHLLIRVDNNLGAETHIHYAPSTAFYLADQAAGTPWLTRLPFPVQVVDRVETYDRISRNRFVTRYAYHHGYFDGVEREFRGFGMVEQWDTEELAALAAGSEAANVDPVSHVPPVWTKTWLHTGAFTDAGRVSRYLAEEYWQEPGLTGQQQAAMLLDDTVLPTGIRLADGSTLLYQPSTDELREACRTLRGAPLRQEVYALDGSEEADRPYLVTETNHTLELLQPRASNRHTICAIHPRETIAAHYERKLYDIEHADGTVARLSDPRVTHELALDADAWGNVLRSATVAYGRRHPNADLDPHLPAATRDVIQKQQTTMHATVTVHGYTNPVSTGPDYRAPLPCEAQIYELVRAAPASLQALVTNLFRFAELRDAAAKAGDGSHDLPYEDTWAAGAVEDHPYRRLIEHTRTLYRRDDLTGPLALGVAPSLALPYETYQLAFTPGLLTEVYQYNVENLLPDPGLVLAADGGYVELDGQWWIPSGRAFYSSDAEPEFAYARAHFFLPTRFDDPFGQTTTVRYDGHDLLTVETRDPLDNAVTADNDYRVLGPWRVTDPNRNRAEALFDAFGLVSATAVRGKPEEQLGDLLDDVEPDLPEDIVLAHLVDPFAKPQPVLGSATTRLLYDLLAYTRTKDSPEPQPSVVYTIARETHTADLGTDEQSKLRHSFAYSDGFGRVIQSKAQAEPGPLTPGGGEVNPRWAGSGWTIFNNKGKPVRQYEPFFTATHHFEFANAVGVSPVLCYDPVERVIATLAPDDTYAKVVFDPWRQITYDGNDTVLLDPRTDTDVHGLLVGYLATQPGWQTWQQRRVGGGMGPLEQTAAINTELHADTPTVANSDTMGRHVLTVAYNRYLDQDQAIEQFYCTQLVLDIEGNQCEAIDARGIPVLRQDFDVAGRLLHTHSPDAGDQWTMPDIAGKPLRRWDSRGHEIRHTYDALRRPVGMWNGDALVELAIYGETHPDALERNLRGRLHRQYDGAGLAVAERHDFKGNLRVATRFLALSYHDRPNWAVDPNALLEAEPFITETMFDALNRPTSQILPDGTEIVPGYNEAGLLETVSAHLREAEALTLFVTDIDYDAKGQRERIAFGNGMVTTYTYDPLTFRLRGLETLRGSDKLQDLAYFYDPVGNITEIRDAAQQTVFFAGQVVAPTTAYVYDAVYRLVSAAGREHASLTVQPDHADPVTFPVPHPNDAQALRNYTEIYTYDQVGNILTLVHHADASSWTRRYSYDPESNRLLAHSLPGDLPDTFSATFAHDPHGNMTAMPHLAAMTWDVEDQFSAADLGGGGTVFYTYNAAGQRVRKVIERPGSLTEERIYLDGFELYRKGSNGTLIFERETVHIMEGDNRIALIETTTVDNSGGSTLQPRQRYQLSNHLGSSTLEVDETAAVISYEEYHPYGTTSLWLATGAAEVSAKRYRYTGKEKDDETLLFYHGARYYASWLARWTAADPARLVDGLGVYTYVRDNPIRLHDPNGQEGEEKEETSGKWSWATLSEMARGVCDAVDGMRHFDVDAAVKGAWNAAGGPVTGIRNVVNVFNPLYQGTKAFQGALEAAKSRDARTFGRDATASILSVMSARGSGGKGATSPSPAAVTLGGVVMAAPEVVAGSPPPGLPAGALISAATASGQGGGKTSAAAQAEQSEVTPPERQLKPGGKTSKTLSQVQNAKGSPFKRGKIAQDYIAELCGGCVKEKVTKTPLGQRRHDVTGEPSSTRTQLRREVKNYRRWLTDKATGAKVELFVKPGKLLEQIQKDKLWTREGRQAGEHRIVQWDFTNARPGPGLVELLKAYGIPYSEVQVTPKK